MGVNETDAWEPHQNIRLDLASFIKYRKLPEETSANRTVPHETVTIKLKTAHNCENTTLLAYF